MPNLQIPRRTWMHVMVATAQIVAAIGTALVSAPQSATASTTFKPAAASTTPITGTVFQDYNSNGTRDLTGAEPNLAIDRGIAGVTVSAYAADGSLADRAISAADGAYTLTHVIVGAPYRIEFTNLPNGYFPAFAGTNSGTHVQFASGGASNIDFGINKPCDFCQNNPSLATSMFQSGDPLPSGSAAGQLSALVQWPYSQTGTIPPTVRATAAQIGATWGLAYQRDTQALFSSTVVRRHAGLGPNGIGAIYKTDASGTSLLVDVVALGVNVGTLPSNAARGLLANPVSPSVDAAAFDAVGKIGIGDIELSEDGKTLYLVNLNERNVYALPIGAPATAPARATRYDLPNVACINGVARPWGLNVRDGNVYVGVVCTGENEPYVTGQITRTNSNLSAMVFAMDTTQPAPAFNTTPVVHFSLDFARGCAAQPFDGDQRNCAWNPWTANYTDGHPTQYSEFTYPSPILSGIDFDDDGSMVLAFSDRWGLQLGTVNFWPDGKSNESGVEGGDLLRAWPSSSQQWTIEFGGDKDGPGPYTATITQTNNQGPGGGEFYHGDKYNINHQETAMGAVAVLQGADEAAATINDPISANAAGIGKYHSETGDISDGYQLRSGKTVNQFGKTAGLGDLELLCNPAPLEIGNRVWRDDNGNGVQDANEPGLANVVVSLIDANGNTATTTTSADGTYYFTQTTSGSSAGPLQPHTVYTLSVPAQVNGLSLTQPNANNNSHDAIDSDGVIGLVSPDTGAVVITTGTAGQNNFDIDFGYVPTATFGNFVWIESDADGIASTGVITPVAGMVITATDQNGVVYTQTTNAQGYYTFTVPVGTYTVTYGATPSGTVPSPTPNGNTASGNNQGNDQQSRPNNTVVTLAANDVISTIDFGFYRTAGLGDFVWEDINHDGRQDSNKPGIANVTVTLKTPTTTLTTRTDANGYYSFTNLIPGLPYSVAFSTPAGYQPTLQNVGDDTKDSDADLITGATHTVTLSSGEFNPTLDAGFWRPAGLGDFVWQDFNHNGVQDAGEPGVNGVSVTLQTPTTTLTAQTDANGYYSFTNLLPGVPYTVSFAAPSGYTFTLPNIGTDARDNDADLTGHTTPVTLKPGEFNATIDAGLWQPMALGNYVWIDSNNDGLVSAGESGVDGVVVNLYRDNGDGVLGAGDTLISNTTTANGGTYLFSNLISGTYLVQIPGSNFDVGAPLFNHSSSTGNGVATTDNNLDNDDDGEPQGTTRNIVSRPVTLTPGQEPDSAPMPNGNTNLSVDFGFFPYASLGDRVWFDANANGIQDTNEISGVAGVQVVLYSAISNQPVATTTTNASGFYNFTQLVPGDYFVQFDLPAGWTRSPQNANNNTDEAIDSDADVTTGRTAVTTLVAGENDPTWDAGLYFTASLGDRVWEDLNRDGVQDAGEPGVSGVIVTLFANGQPISTTTTDALGFYQFNNLTPSVPYTLNFELPAGYQFTLTDANNNSSDAADSDAADSDADPFGNTTPVALAPNEHNPNIDAGIWRPASIGDRVWLDNDRDGVQGANEPGVANVPVTLYQNGVAISATTTDAQGGYAFTGLIPGTYSLTFGLPEGYSRTNQDALGNSRDDADSDANVITGATVTTTLTSGEHDPMWDMGVYPLASLGDYVWIDANRNGQQDAGETPVPNVRVILRDADGTAILTTTTDANGFYHFTNLQPGNYAVQFDLSTLPAHYVPTTQGATGTKDGTDSDADANGRTEVIALAPGENDLTWDLGIYLPTAGLGDHVWLDSNHDGIQGSDEPGVAGVIVTLQTPTTTLTTRTDAHGYYSFTNLLPGETYTVQFGLLPGFAWTQPLVGAPSTDSDADQNGQTTPITLAPDAFDPTIDAGMVSVLKLSKAGVGSGLNGSIGIDNLITYTLTISNNGSLPVSGLVLSDTLPSGVNFISAVTAQPSGTQPLHWNLDPLQPGEVRTISFLAAVDPTSTAIQNHAALLTTLPNDAGKLIVSAATATTPRGPTAIELVAFTARPATNGVQVSWQTGSEINTFGFALYRAERNDRAAATLVTEQMIAAHGPGEYSHIDTTAKANVAYRYWLIEAETNGAMREYGPTMVSVALNTDAAVVAPGVSVNTTPMQTTNGVAVVGGMPVVNPVANPIGNSSAPVAANQPAAQSVVAATGNTVVNATNHANADSGKPNVPSAVVQDAVQTSSATIPQAPASVAAEPVSQTMEELEASAIQPNARPNTQPNTQPVTNTHAPAAQQPSPINQVRASTARIPVQQPAKTAAAAPVQTISPVVLALGIAGTFGVLSLMGLSGLLFVFSRKRRS